VNKRTQVKKLLHAGMKQSEIATLLSISQSTVSRYKRYFTEWRQQAAPARHTLAGFEPTLTYWLNNHLSIEQMQAYFELIGISVNRTALRGFIKESKRQKEEQKHKPFFAEAVIDIVYAGKFNSKGRSINVWLFTMIFSFSHYAYFKEITDTSCLSIINCSFRAFNFFERVPAMVIAKKGRIRDFHPTHQTGYIDFLEKHGVKFEMIKGSNTVPASKYAIQSLRQTFLNPLFYRNFNRLAARLKWWNINRYNCQVHPVTGKVIVSEFRQHEYPALQILPAQPYPFTGKTTRKVSRDGFIQFEQNKYAASYGLVGTFVEVICEQQFISLICPGKTILQYPRCYDKGKINSTCLQKTVSAC
jgi:transcriptional regulator with XRE-family HTH domain